MLRRFRVKYIFWLFFLSLTLVAQDELYREGERLYFAKGCHGCHGIKGEGMHEYPLLANRNKYFLAKKLRFFREGNSNNQQQEMMIGFAQGLSDDDIEAITHFLYNFVDEQEEMYHPEYETWGDGGS